MQDSKAYEPLVTCEDSFQKQPCLRRAWGQSFSSFPILRKCLPHEARTYLLRLRALINNKEDQVFPSLLIGSSSPHRNHSVVHMASDKASQASLIYQRAYSLACLAAWLPYHKQTCCRRHTLSGPLWATDVTTARGLRRPSDSTQLPLPHGLGLLDGTHIYEEHG